MKRKEKKTEIKPEDDIENENIIFFQCKRIIQVRVETGSKRAKKIDQPCIFNLNEK